MHTGAAHTKGKANKFAKGQTYRTMVYMVAYMHTQYRNLATGFTACQDKRET